jgi:4-hydroxybenzoate polyprenyltransferase
VRVLRALSLDVVAGAACGGLLAEHMAQVPMRPGWWIALATAVWCVYTGDHLLDALRATGEPTTHRHAFHLRHARALTSTLAGAVVIGLAAAWTLRPPVRLFGIGLSLAVIAYLASAQGLVLPRLPKEPIAGLLYAAGIWGGPIVTGAGPTPWLVLAALLLALAAVLNLVMLGVFEAETDRLQGHRSLALRWGRDRVRGWTMVASLAGGLAGAALALGPPSGRNVFAILGLQAATPALLLLASPWSEKGERYRLVGDSVFLLGALPRLLG